MRVYKLFSVFLIFSIAAYLFMVISGCGIVQQTTATSLAISSRSPALNATGVSSTDSLSIVFNQSINTSESTRSLAEGSSHTAGTAEGTAVYTWSNNNKTLTVSEIAGWSGGADKIVHIVTGSSESFVNYAGGTLEVGTLLWKYTLAN